MITKHRIPVWDPNHETGYYKGYMQIIENFERSCPDLDVLFLDNTYLSGPEVVEVAKNHEHCVIFNMVDPPYTWHYLQELLGPGPYCMVGTDAPDIPTNFWLIQAHLEFPKYQDQNLRPKDMKVFLNYNYKPHPHRINLIRHIESQNLQHHGWVTTNLTQSHNDLGRVIGLGNIDLWNSHFLNIVSETTFSQHPELIVNEKTIKPMLGLRPFIINGSPRYYDVLESWGIDIFADIFPVNAMRQPSESLQALMDRNHSLICDVIKDLKNENLDSLYQSLYPRLLYNRQRLRELMAVEYTRLCLDRIEMFW